MRSFSGYFSYAAWSPPTRTYNGSGNGDDFAYSVAADKRGNSYVTGQALESSVDWQTRSYAEDGSLRWPMRYDGPARGEDVAKAIAVDDAGDVYVTGYSVNSSGNKDIVVIKYAGTDGSQLWATRWTPAPEPLKDEIGVDIAVDNKSYVYVSGYRGNANPLAHDPPYYVTMKLDAELGGISWANVESESGVAVAIAVGDSYDNVYVTGWVVTGPNGDKWKTVQYAGNGNFNWSADVVSDKQAHPAACPQHATPTT